MRVKVVSVPGLDQARALTFYTETLGFIKKVDVPLGEESRWLTVVSPEERDGTEVLLEPSPRHFEPAKTYQKALLDAGIPYTQFYVDDLDKVYSELEAKGVIFSMKPAAMGTVKIAVFNDTCGNHIQLVQML